MNQFEFSYLLSVHGNAAIPTLSLCELTDTQNYSLQIASAYFVEVLARKRVPHPLAKYRLGNYHEGWAGHLPSYNIIYDYEKYIQISSVGLISNML